MAKSPAASKKPSRKKNQSDEMLCRQLLKKYRELILNGRVVCIDPSSASESSKPGYAIFEKGTLVEAGILDINHRPELRVRLRHVHEELQQFIQGTDVVLIEAVPVRPIRTKLEAGASGKTWMSAKSHGSLIQAVGVTKAAFPTEIVQVNVPASLWHRVCREAKLGVDESGNIIKDDTIDAVRVGQAALLIIQEKQ